MGEDGRDLLFVSTEEGASPRRLFPVFIAPEGDAHTALLLLRSVDDGEDVGARAIALLAEAHTDSMAVLFEEADLWPRMARLRPDGHTETSPDLFPLVLSLPDAERANLAGLIHATLTALRFKWDGVEPDAAKGVNVAVVGNVAAEG